jgi:hypothetical protein
MKEVKVLYNENYKTSKKEVKKDTKRSLYPCSWIGRINNMK